MDSTINYKLVSLDGPNSIHDEYLVTFRANDERIKNHSIALYVENPDNVRGKMNLGEIFELLKVADNGQK